MTDPNFPPQQIRQVVNWAHVDKSGAIVSFGTAQGTDVFLQELAPGLIAVARPDHVTGFDPWRYINGEWTLNIGN